MQELSRRLISFWQQQVSRKLLLLVPTIVLIGLGLAIFSLWLFAKIADGVLENETKNFDTQILLSIHQWHNPWLDKIMLAITFIGQPFVSMFVCIGLFIFLFRRQQRAEALTLAIAFLGVSILNIVLKDVFARARPVLWQRLVDPRFYSFPSGHAMVSMVIYSFIAYLFITQYNHWRNQIAATTILMIILVGFSRLYLGVHWPTDVIAGYAAGFVWLVACTLGLEVWRRRYILR